MEIEALCLSHYLVLKPSFGELKVSGMYSSTPPLANANKYLSFKSNACLVITGTLYGEGRWIPRSAIVYAGFSDNGPNSG